MKKILFETDWLATQPVFYNTKTGKASHNINDVIDLNNLEWHPEGFNNFLDFSYSVFEQTPIRHVKFLRHCSRLWGDESGELSVEYLDDPVEQWLDYRLSEEDIIDLFRERVQEWERSVEGEIVIPTSGGFDSRFLNWCIKDKSRVRSFTYGISDNQTESYEVVHARKLSELLGTRWEQIQLGDFHNYFDDWDKLYGISTHAHGMYHFEFYQKLLPKIAGSNPFLSGIIGDAWSGNVNIDSLEKYTDVCRLGYTHGLQADSTRSHFTADPTLLSYYWESKKKQLEDPRLRVVEAMRFKMVLLSYLRNVPKLFGFNWWTPFLDIDLCMAMLNLPPDRRRGRLWQKEFFKKVGIDLESMNLKATYQNTLDMQGLRRIPVKPLNMNLLKEVVKQDYLEWINKNLKTQPFYSKRKIINSLLNVREVGGALRTLGLKEKEDVQLKAYYAYLVLLPIEKLLRQRGMN